MPPRRRRRRRRLLGFLRRLLLLPDKFRMLIPSFQLFRAERDRPRSHSAANSLVSAPTEGRKRDWEGGGNFPLHPH